MGFAKYAEDNLSRFHSATVIREREHERLKGGQSTEDEKQNSKGQGAKKCRNSK